MKGGESLPEVTVVRTFVCIFFVSLGCRENLWTQIISSIIDYLKRPDQEETETPHMNPNTQNISLANGQEKYFGYHYHKARQFTRQISEGLEKTQNK